MRTQWEPRWQLTLKSQSWWGRDAPVLSKLQEQPLSYLLQGLLVICFGSGSDNPPNNILSLANSWPVHGTHWKNGPLITSKEKQTCLVFATLKSMGGKQVKSRLFSSFELPNILYFDDSKHFCLLQDINMVEREKNSWFNVGGKLNLDKYIYKYFYFLLFSPFVCFWIPCLRSISSTGGT